MDALSRRRFLAVAMGAAASSLLPRRAAAAGFRGTLCLFSKHLPAMDAVALARAVKALGFAGVDLTVRPGGHVEPERAAADLPRFVKTLQGGGLEVPMITTELVSASNRPRARSSRRRARSASRSSSRAITVTRSPTCGRSWDAAATALHGRRRWARACGVQLGFHNHAGYIGGRIWDVVPIVDGLDPHWAGYYFDIRHAVVEGGDGGWRTAFNVAAPRLKMIALKDFFWEKGPSGWRQRNCPLGEGMVDLEAYFAVLARRPASRAPSRSTSNTRSPAPRPRRSRRPRSRRRRRTSPSSRRAWPRPMRAVVMTICRREFLRRLASVPLLAAPSRRDAGVSHRPGPPTSASTRSATATRTTSIARPTSSAGRVVDRVTLLNVHCRVETRGGKSARGFGSMTLGNVWAFPSRTMSYDTTLDAMKALAERIAPPSTACRETGHPLDLNPRPRARVPEGRRASVSRERKLDQPIPKLCTLVVASPFDAAIHDAFGKVHGRNVYATYGPTCCPTTCRATWVRIPRRDGCDRYLLAEPPERIPLFHSVGGLDPLRAEGRREARRRRPPRDAARVDRRTTACVRIKIKLQRRGPRLGRRARARASIASRRQRRRAAASGLAYCLDFNERCPNVAYVLELPAPDPKERTRAASSASSTSSNPRRATSRPIAPTSCTRRRNCGPW